MKKLIFTAVVGTMALSSLQAQFTPGRIVGLRAGDGHVDMSKKQTPAYLDQFNANVSNAAPTYSDAFPTNTAGGTVATMFFNGQAGTEGGMTRSADRTLLTFNGYTGVNMLQSNGTPSKINIPRGFSSTDYLGTNSVYTSPLWFNLTSGGSTQTNPRFTVSDGTNNFWGGGSVTTGGNCLMKWNPLVDPNPVPCTTLINAISGLYITHDTVFAALQYGDIVTGVTSAGITANPPAGIYDFVHTAVVNDQPAIGDFDPFPQMTGGTADLGNLVFAFQAPYTNGGGFAINETTNICYVADSNYGVQKYTNNGVSTWSFAYNFAAGPVAKTNAGCYGIVVDFSGPHPVIYATTTDQSAANGGNITTNRIIRIDDTNSAAAVVTIALAPTNEVFRGIAFAPDLRPLILSQPSDLVVDTNQPVSFSVSATSPYVLGYQWRKAGANISGATGSSYSIASAQGSDAGQFSVIVSNSHGAVTSSVATLTVGRIVPFFVTSPSNTTNYVGDTAVLSAVADGTPTLNFQWYFQGSPVAGATTSTLMLPGVDVSNAGLYYVHVSNPLGFTNSPAVNLTVLYRPVVFVTQPVSTTVITNSTVTLSVVVSGSTNFSYQWKRAGIPLADGATVSGSTLTGTATDTLVINNSTVPDSGNYTVVVSNPAGPATSRVATVTVIVPPAPSTVSYSVTNSVYFQDFNSLPNPGAVGVNTANPVTINGVTYSVGNSFDLAFPALASGGIGGLGLNAMSGWYASADKSTKLGAHAGDNTTGGLISYGLPSGNDRAMGLQATSTTGIDAFGVKIVNNSGVTLDHVSFGFMGEYWRQQVNYELLAFGYYVDADPANPLNTNSVADFVPELNVDFGSRTGGAGPVDGMQATNQVYLGTNDMMVANWAPGTALWLVWQMNSTNSVVGGAQGLGIDNFSFAANSGSVSPTVNVQAGSASVVITWPLYLTDFTLQNKNEVSQAGGWVDVGGVAVMTNGVNMVTIPVSSGTQFYRLAHQVAISPN